MIETYTCKNITIQIKAKEEKISLSPAILPHSSPYLHKNVASHVISTFNPACLQLFKVRVGNTRAIKILEKVVKYVES